ncbi:MAG TPA: SpvB/TcaC N-terminal domain-containing protein, partial [Bradyrhizobium sp.]|nr:SpvB/TcaC N-terminal domain-containing protein [Bradyrhizobium sp.]
MSSNAQAGSQTQPSPFAPPQISLPKGGGAIRGIDEKFAANPVTGTGSLSVALALSAGRSGFGPKLSVEYDSGAGNGIFGFGWQLSLPSITRRTDKGLPQYRDTVESDIFVLSGAEDLVPVLVCDGDGQPRSDEFERDGYRVKRYRPRIEGLFARIERWTSIATGEAHWRSLSKDNILTVYGFDAVSRIADPENPDHVFSWLICRSYDDTGNAIIYDYVAEDAQGVDQARPSERRRVRQANRYPKRIRWGNRDPLLLDPESPSFRGCHTEPHDLDGACWMFEAVFDYGEGHYREATDPDERILAHASPFADAPWPARRDPFSSYRSGFEIRTHRLCRRVLMFHHFPEELGVEPCLVRSTAFEYRQKPIGSFLARVKQSGHRRCHDERYLTRSLPPLDLFYTASPLEDADFAGYRLRDLDPADLASLPAGIDERDYRLLDLDGEGIAGVLSEQAAAWLYKPNLGDGRFGAIRTVAERPSLAAINERRQQFMDLTGDGVLDLVDFAPSAPGFFERKPDAAWAGFCAFHALPVQDWTDPNLRFVDLTGDGIADVLITEDDAFTWHPSLLREGFGHGRRVPVPLDEEHGPRVVFADNTQSLHLADMTGDGLSDLVRI